MLLASYQPDNAPFDRFTLILLTLAGQHALAIKAITIEDINQLPLIELLAKIINANLPPSLAVNYQRVIDVEIDPVHIPLLLDTNTQCQSTALSSRKNNSAP